MTTYATHTLHDGTPAVIDQAGNGWPVLVEAPGCRGHDTVPNVIHGPHDRAECAICGRALRTQRL